MVIVVDGVLVAMGIHGDGKDVGDAEGSGVSEDDANGEGVGEMETDGVDVGAELGVGLTDGLGVGLLDRNGILFGPPKKCTMICGTSEDALFRGMVASVLELAF